MSTGGTIFCSKCGAGGQTPDSYCRNCGEWLPDMRVARRRRGRLRIRTPEERHRRMRVLEALGALSSLSAVLLIVLGMGKKDPGPFMAFALNLCVLTFALQVIAFVIGRGLQKRAEKGRDELPGGGSGTPPQLTPADTGQFVRPPSVTEHTTELLEPGRVRRDG